MNTCQLCDKPLVDTESTDVWLLGTTYDEEGEVIKTSLPVEHPDDYITVGACCAAALLDCWAHFLDDLSTREV